MEQPELLAGLAAAALAACSKPAKPVATPTASAPVPRTPLEGGATPRDAVHMLSRLSFGPRPGEADVVSHNMSGWLEEQLAPQTIHDPRGAAALVPFEDALAPSDQLEEAVAEAAAEDGKRGKQQERRDLLLDTQMTAVARHIASERQLFEVMTDFWTNHFSVSLQKGKVRFLAADFVERTIRPNALGSFVDLLKATARHPAMLLYLDNAESVAPKPGSKQAQKGRGLNENYARELMELHTLGVDGGYTQQDVVEVARVLTGWSVQDGEYMFRSRLHDDGEKTVLGTHFPAGGDEREGVRLLELLATHPATAHHVCTRLCMRLVADSPPPGVVTDAVAVWTATSGNIAQVIRAIVRSPAFWDNSVRNTKVKSPLELVASAVRAVGGHVDDVGLAKVLNKLGQAPLVAPAPTGYADSAAAWLSTASTLERMDVALGLASGKLPGVTVDLDHVLPLPDGRSLTVWRDATLATLDAMIPGGLGDHTRATISDWMARPKQPEQARTLAVALAFASPEFQRQ
ncbi:MAG TPA: DUF1800 domain-containing protein [Kofleriaceae bacterium]|jgi:uncharacterized protein (DUF1800 family)